MKKRSSAFGVNRAMGQQKTQLRNERYRSSMSADTPANVGPITVADSDQRSFRDLVWDRVLETIGKELNQCRFCHDLQCFSCWLPRS